MVQKLVPPKSGKIILGMTGGFGTGKSTVAHFFEELGAYVIDSDRLAHEALLEGNSTYPEVAGLFKEALHPDGKALDRKKIAEIVFHDREKRRKLEALIHPYVLERMTEEIVGADEEVVVLEIPLLFETGFDRYCDQTIVVTAPSELTITRLRQKGYSAEEVRSRMQAQAPLAEKARLADIVIENAGTFEETKENVAEIWKKLRANLKGAK